MSSAPDDQPPEAPAPQAPGDDPAHSQAALDELAGVLAAWGRQALPPEQRARLPEWDKASAVDRQAFRTVLRPLFAGGGPAQRLWEAARKRAVMHGLPEANEGVYAVLWEAMGERLGREG